MKRILSCLIVLLWFGHASAQPCQPPQCLPAPIPFEARLSVSAYPVLFVSDVFPGSVAASAGLRAGDVVLAVNGRFLRSFGTAPAFVAKIRERALFDRALLEVQSALPDQRGGRSLQLLLGNPDGRLGFAWSQAFYVAGVPPGSLADALGIRAGDFIQRIGNETVAANVESVAHFDALLDRWLSEPSGGLTIHRLKTVEDGGRTTWEAREIAIDSIGPLDGPTPPPGATHSPNEIRK
jgi:hypothetical protein